MNDYLAVKNNVALVLDKYQNNNPMENIRVEASENGRRYTSTDAYRLLQVVVGDFDNDNVIKIAYFKPSVVKRLDITSSISLTDNNIVVNSSEDNVKIVIESEDIRYPKVEDAKPQEQPLATLLVNPKLLADTLKKISDISGEKEAVELRIHNRVLEMVGKNNYSLLMSMKY